MKFTPCIRCKKRPAIVFISGGDGINGQPAGYCLQCAKELNIKPVTDLLNQFGMDDEQIELMNDSFNDFFRESDNTDDDCDDCCDDDRADGDFEFGGAPIMPTEMFFNDSEGDGDEEGSEDGRFPFNLGEFFGKGKSGEQPDEEKNNSSKNGKKKKKRKYLNTYCTDLTARAAEGKLDRVIGRDREIERITQILCRRSKNNPCLIGEPGVGKTAIAEGLALRIAEKRVPAKLEDKEIHLLDLTALVAGTQFRGQFESRIKGLVNEVKAEGNIILFIDEVHSLVGTGDSEGTMNAANILKPSLSRGEIQVIGATTFKEYRKHIEKDAALERRFQPVTVNEPSVDEAYDILLGIKDYYTEHHHVAVSDYLLRRAVTLSERYITDRFLPDKAIDLLDEACACASLRNAELTEYDRLTKHRTATSQKLEALMAETEQPDFEAQAVTRAELLQLDEKIKTLEPAALSACVCEADLAKVIELWTGIPASKIAENEQKRLSSLEQRLEEKIIGQNEACELVASAIRRSRVQISPHRHPASFIFVGPTGVGKTELVKVLSCELFNSPETLIRLDMSEFMEKHSVSKIIGSPPGYIGYDEAGQLTEKVRRKPYSVLLFDEIEKAHPDVLNILLQILDEGRITDAQGRVVNFENTVIIMTSNAGSASNNAVTGFGKTAEQSTREHVLKALSDFLRPEFIARVDEIVVFNRLTKEDFEKIAVLMLNGYVKTLGERGIKLGFNSDVPAFLAEKSHGGKSAARDLRNLIRREVEDKIALLLVENPESSPAGINLSVSEQGDHITVNAIL